MIIKLLNSEKFRQTIKDPAQWSHGDRIVVSSDDANIENSLHQLVTLGTDTLAEVIEETLASDDGNTAIDIMDGKVFIALSGENMDEATLTIELDLKELLSYPLGWGYRGNTDMDDDDIASQADAYADEWEKLKNIYLEGAKKLEQAIEKGRATMARLEKENENV